LLLFTIQYNTYLYAKRERCTQHRRMEERKPFNKITTLFHVCYSSCNSLEKSETPRLTFPSLHLKNSLQKSIIGKEQFNFCKVICYRCHVQKHTHFSFVFIQGEGERIIIKIDHRDGWSSHHSSNCHFIAEKKDSKRNCKIKMGYRYITTSFCQWIYLYGGSHLRICEHVRESKIKWSIEVITILFFLISPFPNCPI